MSPERVQIAPRPFEQEPIIFIDPVDEFLDQSLQELDQYLSVLSQTDTSYRWAVSKNLVQSARAHLRQNIPYGPRLYDTLRLLRQNLHYSDDMTKCRNEISLYLRYGEDRDKSDAYQKRFYKTVKLMSKSELTVFADLLANFVGDGNYMVNEVGLRNKYIQSFFLNESRGYEQDLEGIPPSQRQAYIDHPLFAFLMGIYARNLPYFAYELCLILNESPNKDKRTAVINELQPVLTDWDLELLTEHNSWYVCSSAEHNLAFALEHEGFIALCDAASQPLMVVKFSGKFAALVTKSFVTKRGQLIPAGVWLSPVAETTRTKLLASFDANAQRVSSSSYWGKWVLLRNVNAGALEYGGKAMSWDDLQQFLIDSQKFIKPFYEDRRQQFRENYLEV